MMIQKLDKAVDAIKVFRQTLFFSLVNSYFPFVSMDIISDFVHIVSD